MFSEIPGADQIVAWTQVANLRSRRLLDALGMVEIDRCLKHGRPQVLYALNCDDVTDNEVRTPGLTG